MCFVFMFVRACFVNVSLLWKLCLNKWKEPPTLTLLNSLCVRLSWKLFLSLVLNCWDFLIVSLFIIVWLLLLLVFSILYCGHKSFSWSLSDYTLSFVFSLFVSVCQFRWNFIGNGTETWNGKLNDERIHFSLLIAVENYKWLCYLFSFFLVCLV